MIDSIDDKTRDIDVDEQLGKFLDEKYKELGLSIERVHYDDNSEMQRRGVDIIDSSTGNQVYIDEKARQRSANSNTNDMTFTFELTAYPVKNGSRVSGSNTYLGWFVDTTQLSTEYHLVINIEKDNIGYKDCDIYKIKKSDIKTALAGLNLSDTNLIRYATTLRQDIEVNHKGGVCCRRSGGKTGYTYYLLELRVDGQYCHKCKTPLIIREGKYAQFLVCPKNCKEKSKLHPNHGLMFYTDKKYDGSLVPELPINLMLTFKFLVNHCGAKKIY